MATPALPSPPPSHRFQRQGFSLERLIKWFFASNAGLTIVILVLIIVFLLKEGLGFFPGYRRELEIYRIAGLEFVDLSRTNLTAHEQLTSVLNRAYFAEINGKAHRELRRSEEAAAVYNAFTDYVGPTRDLILNSVQADPPASPELVAAMRANYEQQRHLALHKLPASPHLTPEERSALVASLETRKPEDTDDPPLVTALASEYATAREVHAQPLKPFRDAIDVFESAGMDLGSAVMEMSDSVRATKKLLTKADILEKDRNTLMAAASRSQDPVEREQLMADARAALAEKPDIDTPMQELLGRRQKCIDLHQQLASAVANTPASLPLQLSQPEADRLLRAARAAWPTFLADLQATPERLRSWDPKQPVGLTMALWSFLSGKDWVTGGEWQDFYGILPLAVGSLMIALVALSFAIPIGIGSAIYVNQFASRREQAIIKPIIEFIQAIPSVVLGFVGILVLGTMLRELSQLDALRGFPGFPIEERLNIFTAGCLLALMSIPTIFSLAEDALNNVPAAYSEASEALGASRIQTTFRVMIPAAFSGILAAVLLGLGRVIGETMVVLLVAGNRIKIPDFTAGLGTLFQPTHTLTGIIAQELGEVPVGSVHYRALFVVGIVLFAAVLVINATAHRFVNRQVAK